MRTDSYDSDPAIIGAIHAFAAERGYVPNFTETQLNHEVYLSNPRKCASEKLKTMVRHSI